MSHRDRNVLQVNDAMHLKATFSLTDITNESPTQIVLNGKKINILGIGTYLGVESKCC